MIRGMITLCVEFNLIHTKIISPPQLIFDAIVYDCPLVKPGCIAKGLDNNYNLLAYYHVEYIQNGLQL